MKLAFFAGIIVAITGFVMTSCGGKATTIPPGSRLIMQGNSPLWSLCDKGHRIYMTESGQMQVIPLACLDGQP